MNITLNKTDSANATITVEVTKADYVNEVEKSLKKLQKDATMPGFRKGMIPPSFLRQRYGKSVLIEELNKIISERLSDYIQQSRPGLLGEPLPSESQAPVDFDTQEDFTFIYDIALSPEIDIELTKDDHLPYYSIQVTTEMIDRHIEHLLAQSGDYVPVEEVEDKDSVKGRLVELDENGEPKRNGIINDYAVLMPMYMKNEDEKAKFLHAKPNSLIVFNPYEAYKGNEPELASFLRVGNHEVNHYTDDFSFEIREITRYQKAELNQKFFDKVFKPGTVDSEEMFREKVKEDIYRQLSLESDYKFILDARKLLIEKASGMQFPDAFLKRWLLASDTKRTPESLEEEYPKILEDLKFHLIKEHLLEKNNIIITENDLQEYARLAARAQFAHYGIYNVDDDLVNKYAQEMLKKKDTCRSLSDKVFEDRLIAVLKEQAALDMQELTMDEFQKLIV